MRTRALTFNKLQRTNTARLKRWHADGQEEWTLLEWAGAMCGEAGEAANAAKKLKRLQTKMRNLNTEKGRKAVNTIAKAKKVIAKECADTIIYAVLLTANCGIEAEDVLREVFNTKSEEYGFPERI